MHDTTDLNERRKALHDRISEMKQEDRDRQIQCRNAIKAEYDEIRKLPGEERQEHKRAIQGRLLETKQLHDKQKESLKALEDQLREIRRLQAEERFGRKKPLCDQLVEKMEQAREEHIRKHHSKEPEFLPDRGDTEVRKGFLKLHILGVLAEGPSHGYEIMHRIGHHTGHIWRPSPGSMYPALETLESNGFISCHGDGRRKVYSLTPKGQNVLDQIRKKHEEQFYEMKTFMSALLGE